MSFYSIFKSFVMASMFMAFSKIASGSQETVARMLAQMNCERYGESSSICESAKRDIERAIAMDKQMDLMLQGYGGRPSSSYSPPPTYDSGSEYPTSPQYKSESNTITFSNQSGEPALVKIRGATSTQTFVPNGSLSTVNASGGTHYILVRYGSSPPYTYSKGESFSVDETATQYSAITITLHKVAHGNYSSSSTSQAEFDSR